MNCTRKSDSGAAMWEIEVERTCDRKRLSHDIGIGSGHSLRHWLRYNPLAPGHRIILSTDDPFALAELALGYCSADPAPIPRAMVPVEREFADRLANTVVNRISDPHDVVLVLARQYLRARHLLAG